MKKLFALLISLLLILLLTACDIGGPGNQPEQTPDDPNCTHTHSGGVATCNEKAICSDCKESYGSYDENNHANSEFTYAMNSDDDTKHDKIYSCCGIVESTSVHKGGVATCMDKAICSDCKESYGSYDENNHANSEFTYTMNLDDAMKHDKTYSCCGIVESTSFHKGGTVTLSERAICEICNEEYGDLATPGLDYTLSKDGTYYIVSSIGVCTSTDIVIPAIYEDLPVKEIQSNAFSYSNITSVIIPEGVTTIGERAFDYCTSLVSVTIPSSVNSCDLYAFRDCESLMGVYITDIAAWCEIDFYSYDPLSNPLYYAKNLYLDHELVTDLVIPDSVTSINRSAFQHCNITSVIIPDGVTSIGEGAFKNCTNLERVTISEGVAEINDYAFYGCQSLVSITIGNGVTRIGNESFTNCINLNNITLPESVEEIGTKAFSFCYRLTSITIPKNVESIGDDVFFSCPRLVEIVNHSHVRIKVDSTFEIHNGDASKIDNVDGYLFYTYKNTNYLISYVGQDTELTLPADYKGEEYVIHDYAFYGFRNITSITISDGVKSIGKAAFAYCRELTSITISSNVKFIGVSAIRFCDSLTNVYYTGAEEEWAAISIGFYNDSLTSATVHYNYSPKK